MRSSNRFCLAGALALGCAAGAGAAGCGGSSQAKSDAGTDAGTVLPPPAWDWAGVIGTGQSLEVGQGGTPESEAASQPPYDNLMLGLGGLTVPPFDPTSSALKTEQLSEYMRNLATSYPSAYPQNLYGETPHTAMATEITALYIAAGGADYVTAHTEVGESGQAYVELEKGATDTGTMGRAYAASLFEAQALTNLATAAGKTYGVGAVFITHGEADAGNADYEADLAQLWLDYNQDLSAITGQTQSIPLLVSQQQSTPSGAGATSASLLAQWMVGLDHPGDIICTGPKYQYPYWPNDGLNTHLTTPGYEMLGEKYGQVYFEKVVLGQDWQPLQPSSIDMNGNLIDVHFHVPTPPLQWVADAVLPAPQQDVPEWMNGRGFEVRSAGAPATITSVAIVGDDTVEITLESPLATLNSSVGYAFSANSGPSPGGTIRWGQLSDSDALTGALSGMTQPNFAVSFQASLPWTPPASP